MTRMFLEDDDNLSDDVFNDASPQGETEKRNRSNKLTKTKSRSGSTILTRTTTSTKIGTPISNRPTKSGTRKRWKSRRRRGRRTAPISPTRTKRKTRKKNDLRYVRRLFRGGSGGRASCEGGEAASQSIAERVARPPNVAESGAVLFGFACRAEQLRRRRNDDARGDAEFRVKNRTRPRRRGVPFRGRPIDRMRSDFRAT